MTRQYIKFHGFVETQALLNRLISASYRKKYISLSVKMKIKLFIYLSDKEFELNIKRTKIDVNINAIFFYLSVLGNCFKFSQTILYIL